LIERVLFDDVYASDGNRATGIDIIAEVEACYRLKGLRPAEIVSPLVTTPLALTSPTNTRIAAFILLLWCPA
jgi:hypothetical protein